MELIESIDNINKWLARDFTKEVDGRATWRVVLAGEQIEKRIMDTTNEGFELLRPEVREVRKYQHILPNRYVLERLVPVQGETDLIEKMSYEPAWVFEDRHGNYLPPLYAACRFVIEAIYSQQDRAGSFKQYKDPDQDPMLREQKIKDMEHKLFGNETPVGDALAHKYGVTDFHQKVEITSLDEKKEVTNVSD